MFGWQRKTKAKFCFTAKYLRMCNCVCLTKKKKFIISFWQGWEFAHLLIAQITWAIRSGRSEKMSDVIESLILLKKNKGMSDSLNKFWLTKSWNLVLLKVLKKITHFLFFGERCEWIAHFAQIKWAMWANRSFRSPKMSDHERFAQVAQRKWAIVSESLILLTKNERMSESLIFLSESLIHSFFDQKRAIRSEIKWANSHPCILTFLRLVCEFEENLSTKVALGTNGNFCCC